MEHTNKVPSKIASLSQSRRVSRTLIILTLLFLGCSFRDNFPIFLQLTL